MEHVLYVQVRHSDPVKTMKNLLAQIDTKAAELHVGAVGFRTCEPVGILLLFVSCVISSSIVLDVGS